MPLVDGASFPKPCCGRSRLGHLRIELDRLVIIRDGPVEVASAVPKRCSGCCTQTDTLDRSPSPLKSNMAWSRSPRAWYAPPRRAYSRTRLRPVYWCESMAREHPATVRSSDTLRRNPTRLRRPLSATRRGSDRVLVVARQKDDPVAALDDRIGSQSGRSQVIESFHKLGAGERLRDEGGEREAAQLFKENSEMTL